MNTQRPTQRGSIAINVRGEIEVTGRTPYYLPETLTTDFVCTLCAYKPGDELFIDDLFRMVPGKEKRRLRDWVVQENGAAFQDWLRLAYSWPAVMNEDNQWHVDDYEPIYEVEVNQGWAKRILITDQNGRFILTPQGYQTFIQFRYVYDIDITDYLCQRQERTIEHLDEVRRHIASSLVHKRITAVDPGGRVVALQIAVLESQGCHQWHIPAGYQFLAEYTD